MQVVTQDRSRLIVKNTFLDVVDAPHFEGLRTRASSDPTLFETAQQQDDAFKGDDDDAFEFELTGMSDTEGNTEDERVVSPPCAPLPCYRHIDEAPRTQLPPEAVVQHAPAAPSTSPCSSPSRQAPPEEAAQHMPPTPSSSASALNSPTLRPCVAPKASPEEAVQHMPPTPSSSATLSNAPSPQPCGATKAEMDRLASENRRLVLENKMLRDECLGNSRTLESSGAGQARTSVACGVEPGMAWSTAEAAGSSLPVPSAVEAMWVQVGFMMASRAASSQASSSSRAPMQGLQAAGKKADRLMSSCRQRPRLGVPPVATAPLADCAARKDATIQATNAFQAEALSQASRAGIMADLPNIGLANEPSKATYSPTPDCKEASQPRTTVMLRNLPNNYTRVMVLDLLDSEGFKGKYDFLYLPIDFKSRACLGYAFINLVDPADTSVFWERFDGYTDWVLPSKKVCHVGWSGPHQGLDEHVERYRNSPVMHKSVPDEYKPVLFRQGMRVNFPLPTKPPRAPRIRHMNEFRAAATSQAFGGARAMRSLLQTTV